MSTKAHSLSEQAIQLNHQAWNHWATLHPDTSAYDMQKFRETKNSLTDLALQLLGDVRGKKILHLQCHFGQDTLSLAHLGAEVTGVDISENAINYAKNLSQEFNIPAEFIVGNVLELALKTQFDVVFTSYGVLCWLPDIGQWADVIAQHLKPGGRLVMVEFHPFLYVTTEDMTAFDSTRRYHTHGQPIVITNVGSYAAATDDVYVTHEFNHGLANIVMALKTADIHLENFQEYLYSSYNCFQGLVENPIDSGQFTHPVYSGPLMFSMNAVFRPQYIYEMKIAELEAECQRLRTLPPP